MVARCPDWLAEAGWLHRERARAWCVVLLAVSIPWAAFVLGSEHRGLDRNGHPVGTDFVSFWVAARTALAEGAAAVYDPSRHAAAEHTLFPGLPPDASYAFFYPPTFLLICLPLGLLPYLVALALWVGASLAALVAGLRRLLPQRWAILPILGDPAMLLNALHGQNAFLSAACIAWGTVLLETRPLMAGAAFGLLAFKPHLALAIPVALLAAGRLRAVAGAACAAAMLACASWFAFGTAAWAGFHHVSALARATLVHGYVDPWKMVSAFAAVRVAGGGVAAATAVQAVQAVTALTCLAWVARRCRPGGRALGAAMTAASLLATPFVLDYDLTLLAIPLAWLAAEAQRTGWRRWEKVVALLAFTLPFVARDVAGTVHVPLAPAVIWLLYAVVLRRLAAAREPVANAVGGFVHVGFRPAIAEPGEAVAALRVEVEAGRGGDPRLVEQPGAERGAVAPA